MKILFHNYSNSRSTEAMYLHTALSNCGVQSDLWSNRTISAYDVFDRTKPSVFDTSFQMLTNDIMTYLKENRGIDMIMNVTGATSSQLQNIESVLEQNNVSCPFFFTNSFSAMATSIKTKLHYIYPAADIFAAGTSNKPEYGIKDAIVSDSFSEKVQELISQKDVFHLLYIGENQQDSNFDIKVSIQSLNSLYRAYDKFTIVGDNSLCCSQLLFDAILSAKNVDIKSSDQDGFYSMLQKVFKESSSEEDIASQLKSQIKARHTPFHRAWTLMKHLQNKDAMANIDKFKEKLPELIKGI